MPLWNITLTIYSVLLTLQWSDPLGRKWNIMKCDSGTLDYQYMKIKSNNKVYYVSKPSKRRFDKCLNFVEQHSRFLVVPVQLHVAYIDIVKMASLPEPFSLLLRTQSYQWLNLSLLPLVVLSPPEIHMYRTISKQYHLCNKNVFKVV